MAINSEENLFKQFKELAENVEKLKKEVKALKNGSYITDIWIDSHDLTRTLNVTSRTLNNFAKQGFFKVTKMGRTNYYKKAEILEFLEVNHKYYIDDKKPKKPDQQRRDTEK